MGISFGVSYSTIRSIVVPTAVCEPCLTMARSSYVAGRQLIDRQPADLLDAARRIGARERHRQLRHELAVLHQLDRRFRRGPPGAG